MNYYLLYITEIKKALFWTVLRILSVVLRSDVWKFKKRAKSGLLISCPLKGNMYR